MLLKSCLTFSRRPQSVLKTFGAGSSRLHSNLTEHQKNLMAKGLPKRQPINGVKHIIVVASGKGGVGKSTTSVNLAATLSQMGQRVGILDADVLGSSIPLMINLSEMPLVNDDNLIIPPENYNMKCLSMGLLTDDTKPIIWRGPLLMSALQRIMRGVIWGPLDILVIDTPPGTGDIHLSLSQNVPISGVLLVSTPQKAALDVTKRGAEMYRMFNVPVIGILENMRHVYCDNCQTNLDIFGSKTEEVANQIGIEVIGSVAMERNVTECCDDGVPAVLKYKDSNYAKTFWDVGEKVVKFIENTSLPK